MIKFIDSRLSSVLGLVLSALAALATPQGCQVLTDLHVPASLIKDIDDLQGFLLIAGVGMMARGAAALGGDPKHG